MKHTALIATLLTLTLGLAACEGYRTPTTSQNPERMTDHALCYRGAVTKNDSAIATEINKRHLNCRDILADDPILNQNRY